MNKPKPMTNISLPVEKLYDARLGLVSTRGMLAYFLLYLLAGRCNLGGKLVVQERPGKPLNAGEIAHLIRFNEKEMTGIIKELIKAGKVSVDKKNDTITMVEFSKEQIDIERKRESNRIRQRRHRTRTHSLLHD